MQTILVVNRFDADNDGDIDHHELVRLMCFSFESLGIKADKIRCTSRTSSTTSTRRTASTY